MARGVAGLDATVGLHNVPVWHCNDAKAARGSRLDRHQHIGEGTIGREPFRRLLNDPRLARAAFIAETPIAETALATDLTAAGVPFHLIGDAVAPRRASLAFYEGRELARRL